MRKTQIQRLYDIILKSNIKDPELNWIISLLNLELERNTLSLHYQRLFHKRKKFKGEI